MTWTNGRRLATISATNDHAALSFTYDSDGLRLTKTAGTEVHKYTWQGSKLISEQYGTTTLEFFYDESGAPYALLVRDTASATPTEALYYYVTNLQGDVMQILDAGGNTVASYTYNAWGKILNLNNSTSASIGDLNPIRYREYYYDTETGLYYLKSRYYDPEICRFVNADGLASTGQGFLGANMFAYCLNNPVNLSDQYGSIPVSFELFEQWLSREGGSVYYDSFTNVSKKISRSRTIKEQVDQAIIGYKERGETNQSGSVTFTSVEPDLWLGVRNADYKLSITEEKRTVTLLPFWKFTFVRYVATIQVSDTYDFNIGNEQGDGIGSDLNNIGYGMQIVGLGKEYYWSTSFTYYTRWKLYA